MVYKENKRKTYPFFHELIHKAKIKNGAIKDDFSSGLTQLHWLPSRLGL